jgi:hypothetical protein
VPVAPGSVSPPQPILVHSGYRSFNIIQYGEQIYAIPQGQGAFEIERINRNEYNPWFSGRSVDEVQRLIDQYLLKSDLNTGR